MAKWTCPECGRPFGRVGQGHLCAPGLSLDEYFATGHERERPIFEAVVQHLGELGPLDVDLVQVGILFKNGPTFAELRPMVRWVALSFVLPVEVDHPRLARKVRPVGRAGTRWYHVVNITDASEIDRQILDWLTEAYLACE